MDTTGIALVVYRKLKQVEHKAEVLNEELNGYVQYIPPEKVEGYLAATLQMDAEFALKTEKALRPKRRGRPRFWKPRERIDNAQ